MDNYKAQEYPQTGKSWEDDTKQRLEAVTSREWNPAYAELGMLNGWMDEMDGG